VRRHPFLLMFVSMLVMVLAIGIVPVWANTRANQRFVAYQVQNKVDVCRNTNESRHALQTVLDQASKQTVGFVDFATVPGWDSLPTETQVYLRNLETALSKPITPTNLQQIAAKYRRDEPANADCVAVGERLRSKLDGR
jgi:hypothetical protein